MTNQIDSSNLLKTPQDVQSFANKLTQEQKKTLLQELQKDTEIIADMPISEGTEKVNKDSLFYLPQWEFRVWTKAIFNDQEDDSPFN